MRLFSYTHRIQSEMLQLTAIRNNLLFLYDILRQRYSAQWARITVSIFVKSVGRHTVKRLKRPFKQYVFIYNRKEVSYNQGKGTVLW